MRIKKFVDEDMIRLIRRVKRELGPEAVIVSTSRLDDGRSELVAAVEDDEIDFSDAAGMQVYPAGYNDNRIRERLDYHEVSTAARSDLLARCRQYAASAGENDDIKILTAVFDRLFARYNILDTRCPVKVFTGIQGSGKTTALVKTAALAKFRGLSAALISTDGLRAGANSQLQSFAGILGAKFRFVRKNEHLAAAIKEAQAGHDLVLIDTPGFNPFVSAERERLRELLDIADGEAVLALEAGYNAPDAREAAAIYASLGAKNLLPTKLDLCRRIGGFLSAATEEGFNLGWASVSGSLSNGLAAVDNAVLARLVLA